MCQKTAWYLLLVFAVYTVRSEKFKVIREWNYLNFTWPSEEMYSQAEARGSYMPENNIIAGIKYFEDYFYVSLPRMKNGVPATLARIPAGLALDTAPLLEPFPSWEMNNLGDCNALQNVQNIEIDTKGQLWIIDSGRTETLSNNPSTRCSPKILIVDMKKNMTTTAYTFPDSVASFQSNFLYDIVVDDSDGGYAYITDNSARDPGIIVFSVKDHHSWKIRHSQTMKADPTATAFRVNAVPIQAPINLASIALGPRIHIIDGRIVVDEDREVFYSPLSSLHLYSINSSVLRNEMNGGGEYQGEVKDVGLKSSQTVGMLMDNQGVLYYSLLASNSIAKWNSDTPFQSGQKIIARDANFLEWPNSFTFDNDGNITVLVNRLNRFIYNNLDLNQVNFRLITSKVGGKSYLYDQAYDYETDKVLSTSSMTPPPNSDSNVPHGVLQPDPFLVPQREPKGTVEPKLEPEPTAEPEPTGNHMDHDHDHSMNYDHDHMNHDQNVVNFTTTEKSADPNSGRKIEVVFLSVFFAGFLFLF